MVQRVLVVDDESMLREAVASYLEKQGCAVYTAGTGRKALEIFEKEAITFTILDLMLPDISGEEICRIIRKKSRVPILMLTAKSQEEDILCGLSLGADDYMTKPFSLRELYARMNTILRRSSLDLRPLASKYSWNDGDLRIDFDHDEVYKKGELLALTPIERKILWALLRHPKKNYTREELIKAAFEPGFDGYDRVVDTHVKNLRKKVEDDPKNPVYVKTVHGIGYKFGGESQ